MSQAPQVGQADFCSSVADGVSLGVAAGNAGHVDVAHADISLLGQRDSNGSELPIGFLQASTERNGPGCAG